MDKGQILDEIRRTAAANNGVALGIRTFAKETGIKDADWLGKYWARWSDAVKEAGLTPNEKQTAFDIAGILEKVILLSRAHGRLPFKAEMQVESHKNENFPSINYDLRTVRKFEIRPCKKDKRILRFEERL